MVYITYNGISINYSHDIIYFNYKTKSGRIVEPYKDFENTLKDKKLIASIKRALGLLKENGYFLKMPFVKRLEEGIYELRITHSNNAIRILYFYDDKTIVLTNAFIKKTQKLPRK